MPELTSPATVLLLWGAIGYLLGSIPTGVLAARVCLQPRLEFLQPGELGVTFLFVAVRLVGVIFSTVPFSFSIRSH